MMVRHFTFQGFPVRKITEFKNYFYKVSYASEIKKLVLHTNIATELPPKYMVIA
jgi:hypothetical protein